MITGSSSPSYSPPDQPSTDSVGSRTDDAAITAGFKASIQILIVDDDRTLREGCASVLQMDGYNVTFIGRGDEALETIRRRKFDIVLLDLFMSIVPGMELLKAVLATNKESLVIVMTGNP